MQRPSKTIWGAMTQLCYNAAGLKCFWAARTNGQGKEEDVYDETCVPLKCGDGVHGGRLAADIIRAY